MLLRTERELVIEYGKKMSESKLSPGTSGNISIYNRKEGLIAISPSGIDYSNIKPEDVVIIDIDGNVIDGNKKPSSELELHTIFYKNKPETKAIVHTHSIYCTTFATLNMPLQAVHYVIGDAGVPSVPCAPYKLFGTKELAEAAIEVCGNSEAVLLGNHGCVACGDNIKSAYSLACNLEYIAEIQYRTMCIGKPNILSADEIQEVIFKFKSYGQVTNDERKKCY